MAIISPAKCRGCEKKVAVQIKLQEFNRNDYIPMMNYFTEAEHLNDLLTVQSRTAVRRFGDFYPL